MNDYIKREEAVEKIRRLRDKCGNDEMAFALNWGSSLVQQMLSSDVRENVHAHWEEVDVIYGDDLDEIPNLLTMRCGKCKLYHTTLFFYGRPSESMKFCPRCGAVMDEEAQT